MTFDNPEVVELGMAEELIRDEFGMPNSEGTTDQSRIKLFSAIYVAETE